MKQSHMRTQKREKSNKTFMQMTCSPITLVMPSTRMMWHMMYWRKIMIFFCPEPVQTVIVMKQCLPIQDQNAEQCFPEKF